MDVNNLFIKLNNVETIACEILIRCIKINSQLLCIYIEHIHAPFELTNLKRIPQNTHMSRNKITTYENSFFSSGVYPLCKK